MTACYISKDYMEFLYRCIQYLTAVLFQPPVITGLPSAISLIESATGSTTTAIFTLTVADPEGDSYTCAFTTTPVTSGFQIIASKQTVVRWVCLKRH